MSRSKASDDQLNKLPDESAIDQPKSDDDAEGHMFNIDPSTARQLSRVRSADADREARERQRQKEARPNRR
jgi:hypothetical protein